MLSLLGGVIRLDFDPVTEIAGLAVRLQTIALAFVILLCLLVALLCCRRSGSAQKMAPLRADDLLFIVLGVIPGAVIGGRLLHGLAYWDIYGADPQALLDPARGTLSLLGAVLGGAITGGYTASLLDGALGRWADALSIPTLLAIGLGKLSQVLGGAGQGAPADGANAVAFIGEGPWTSLAAGVPAHPSQVYEAVWTLSGIPVLMLLMMGPLVRRVASDPSLVGDWAVDRSVTQDGIFRRGALFLIALAWWVSGRFFVASTWRDEPVWAGLNAEQLMAAATFGGLICFVLLAEVAATLRLRHLRRRRRLDAERAMALARRRALAGAPLPAQDAPLSARDSPLPDPDRPLGPGRLPGRLAGRLSGRLLGRSGLLGRRLRPRRLDRGTDRHP